MMPWGSNVERVTDFLLVDSGTYFSESFVWDFQREPDVSVLDMYDLPYYDLSLHKFLIVDGFVDQELMYRQREQIRRFLDVGNILVFGGNLFRHWIPGASLFVPKTIRHFRDYSVRIHHPHPIFEGVDEDDLTYNKGVAGFFARGHHPVPPHAEILLTFVSGEPITYIDRTSTRGTILVHSGSNLLSYSARTNSAGRIGVQLRKWLYEEYERIKRRGTR